MVKKRQNFAGEESAGDGTTWVVVDGLRQELPFATSENGNRARQFGNSIP
jgi:hypothetical protein